jgi:predicted transcriptional regulator
VLPGREGGDKLIGGLQPRRDLVKTAKDEVQEILKGLPDDATLEEIQYRIYVRQKIERGLKDLDEGRTVSHEEMKKRVSSWHSR